MAHPSLNRKSAIIINAILLLSLALISIYKLILILLRSTNLSLYLLSFQSPNIDFR